MSRITATVLIDMNHNYDLNFRTGIMCGIISRWFVKGCLPHPYNYWDDDLWHRWHPNDDVVMMVLIHIASYHDSKNDPMCSKNIRIMILHMMTCVDIAVWQWCVMIHSWQLIITWIIPMIQWTEFLWPFVFCVTIRILSIGLELACNGG